MKCPLCEKELLWLSDDDDYIYDEPAICGNYECQHCNAYVQKVQPTSNVSVHNLVTKDKM